MTTGRETSQVMESSGRKVRYFVFRTDVRTCLFLGEWTGKRIDGRANLLLDVHTNLRRRGMQQSHRSKGPEQLSASLHKQQNPRAGWGLVGREWLPLVFKTAMLAAGAH